MLFLTGDISGGEWAKVEFGRDPWDDPPTTTRSRRSRLAGDIRTPLLIQHSERDLRTTVGQAEALFTRPPLAQAAGPVHARPRRDPRADAIGTPFRRAENLVQVRDWFVHFLVDGARRSCPPRRRTRRALGRAAGARRATGVSSPPMRDVRRPRQRHPRAGPRAHPRVRRAAPGASATLLGRVTPVDQVGVEERVDVAPKRARSRRHRSSGRSTSRSG